MAGGPGPLPHHVAVTAVGADRPGIVAAVTGVLMDHRANLEDTSMTILRGHFAMMLVVAVPQATTAAELEAALEPVADELGLVVTVRGLDEAAAAPTEGSPWHLAVYGADRPGIVHRVTRLLAERGVNVADLTTRVIGDEDHPVYAMLLEVVVPDELDPRALERDLAALADDLGVDHSLSPSEADIL